LVYQHIDFRFTLLVWDLGNACRLERGLAFKASSIEKAQAAAAVGEHPSFILVAADLQAQRIRFK